MKLIVESGERLEGSVRAPPSKSHTHRAIIIASLASGESVIENPLECDDTLATIDACRMLGAEIDVKNKLIVKGVAGKPRRPDSEINVRNSGTTMRFMTAVSALCKGATILTGDDSVRTRPIAPLLASLTELGAPRARSFNNDGCPPVTVTGRMTGGNTRIDGQSSQFVSALLLACPLADNDSLIEVTGLRSRPYVDMTLGHMERCGVRVWGRETSRFLELASKPYKQTNYTVPGDHSSAAFLRVAGEITSSEIEITGLDEGDSQGDRVISDIMSEMRSGESRTIDLSDNPDLLPILAVLACHSDGETILGNVQHARAKESDRIAAMCSELRKMGANVEERPDGLAIRKSQLRGAELDGHGDHRIVMALAVAGLTAGERTIINGADAISKSYPGFVRDLASLGAKIRMVEE
jgi:3-phosphoshikimate 1-carboxyvinyltransferase